MPSVWSLLLVVVLGVTPGSRPALVEPPTLRRAPPETVGMSSDRLREIDRVVSLGLGAGGYPGAAVVIGRRGAIVWQRGYGVLDPAAEARVDAGTTLYDLASITKAVATTTAVMLLCDAGILRLSDPVARFLPEFRGSGKERVTIEHLLTHRAGLPAGAGLSGAHTVADARTRLMRAPLVHEPGTRTLYSDAGPQLLALVVERAAGEPMDRLLTRRVYRPLGMRSTTFRPMAAYSSGFVRANVAPTSTAPAGDVHDANARALGGVAGHAGLFSTGFDLAVFAQMLLYGGELGGVRVLHDSTVARFVRRTAGWRALGWDTCAGGASCGQHMTERAFGHTGFTGTSLWIDPDREMFVIVLTNQVVTGTLTSHAVMADVRADIADIAATAVLGQGKPAPLGKLRADAAIGWR